MHFFFWCVCRLSLGFLVFIVYASVLEMYFSELCALTYLIVCICMAVRVCALGCFVSLNL